MQAEQPASGMRVLLVKLSSFGDLFHALPVADALHQHLGATVDWVTQTEYAELVDCFGPVNQVLPYPRRDKRARKTFWKTLQQQGRYDLALDLQGLLKSAWVVRRAKASIRIGPSFQREGARFLYNRVAGSLNKQRHAVDECMEIARELGVPDHSPRFPVVFPEPRGLPERRFVVLAPFSRWGAKNWPLQRFAEVGRHVASHQDMDVLVVGAPTDREVADSLVEMIGASAANWCGRVTLPEVGGILRQAALLVCNDSGPMHMASAARTPTVALFGPTSALRTGPWGEQAMVLRPARFESTPELVEPFRHDDDAVMREIEVDDVLSAVDLQLAG